MFVNFSSVDPVLSLQADLFMDLENELMRKEGSEIQKSIWDALNLINYMQVLK